VKIEPSRESKKKPRDLCGAAASNVDFAGDQIMAKSFASGTRDARPLTFEAGMTGL